MATLGDGVSTGIWCSSSNSQDLQGAGKSTQLSFSMPNPFCDLRNPTWYYKRDKKVKDMAPDLRNLLFMCIDEKHVDKKKILEN